MKKILSVILVLVLALSLTACGKETISLNDYLKVEFSGTNGEGKATVTGFMDFEEDLMQKSGGKITLMQLAVLESGIDYDIDKKDGLSNGDKVKMTITIDEDLKDSFDFKFVGKDATFTVEGLPEKVYKEVDPFADIECAFNGNEPFITCTVNSISTGSPTWDDRYTITYPDETQCLKNGDSVTLHFTYDAEKAEKDAIKYTQTEKTFTVEGHDKYVMSIDELSDAQLNKVIDEANAHMDEALTTYTMIPGDNSYYAKDEPNLERLGYYFFTAKDELVKSAWLGHDKVGNSIYFVYAYDTTASLYGTEQRIYRALQLENLILDANGELHYDSEDFIFYGAYKSADSMKNDFVEKYSAIMNCVNNTTLSD